MSGANLARLAAEPELGRVLLAAVAGELRDTAEALALLAQAVQMVPSPALQAAVAALPAPPQAPGEREVWVRGMAAGLLAPTKPPAKLQGTPLPAPVQQVQPLPLLGTLSHWSDEERWTQATERALSTAQEAGQPCITLALRSWGDWLGARELLSGRYGEAVGGLGAPICVITLEDAVGLLSAASAWALPDLARLLSGPVILDGLQSLGPQQRGAVSELLADTAEVFGLSALLLSAGPLNVPGWTALEPPTAARPGTPSLPEPVTTTLEKLAAAVQSEPTDALVVLPSRGSAARLAALMPGSVLWSSSLCPVHLGDLAHSLAARRRSGERCLLVATSLPPLQLGSFETVWHTLAPLPYLAEAWQRCSGTFRRLRLSDVALPVGWIPALGITDDLLRGAAPPQALGAYQDWADQSWANQSWANQSWTNQNGTNQNRATTGSGRPLPADPDLQRLHSDSDLRRLRSNLDFASLEAALQVRPATSRPALISYDDAARDLSRRALELGHLPPSALRYAAWLTPGEAALALRRGLARPLGWALLWDAPYDPLYGLAATLIEDSRYARGS